MTTGQKLTGLRKEKGLTQEELAELLGVSRQSVSKWESDAAYPETEKLVRLGELFGCSMDYLLKESVESHETSGTAGNGTNAPEKEETSSFTLKIPIYHGSFERKSKKTIRGVPLWHVNIGLGRTAKGIFAVGFRSVGVFSVGLLSLGVFSFGILSIGLISLGVMAIGLAAAGSVAAGIVALGAVAFGIFSVGAVAVGEFSVGALAVGKYFAMGDHAHGAVAIGKTVAEGAVTAKTLASVNVPTATRVLDEQVPGIFRLFTVFVKSLF